MSFEIITYLFLSVSSCFLGALYFLYPKNAIKFFLVLSLILPTSNQFMNYTSFSGIYFELWSENSSDLAEGTYSYNDTEDAFTYTIGEIFKDVSTETFSGEYFEISSGELEVNKNGNNYEFTCLQRSDSRFLLFKLS